MAYNHKLAKLANKTPIVMVEEFHIYDTDRYVSDDYIISLVLQERIDRFCLGVCVTSNKVGVSEYQEYWVFEPEDKSVATTTFNECKKRLSKVTNDFTYHNSHAALLNPAIRSALIDVEVGHKEKSGVTTYNSHLLDPYKEPDWRVSLYGNRYPKPKITQLKENWVVNSDEVSRQIEVDGKGTRDRINKYRYADQTKLAQFNRMLEMVQKAWPYLSTAAIISFLTIFLAKGGSPDALAQQIETNPQQVRSQIPEMEPDYSFDQDEQQEETPPPTTQPQRHFDGALQQTLQFEGGYVNHPNDPGGETNKGITRRSYQEWLMSKGMPSTNIDMKNIPEDHVLQFYRDKYWNKVGGDSLPQKTAYQLFDYAVQSGVKRAVQALQEIVGSKPDGVWGPTTLRDTQAYVATQGDDSLAQAILTKRTTFITELSKQERFKPFAKGWMNRLNALSQLLQPEDEAKPMRMRSRNVPKSQISTFQTPQADFLNSTTYSV